MSNKFQVISTKVSADSYVLLMQLCARQGVTIYEFLQMVCDTLIRYMDDRHNMTPAMEQAMSIFDHMQGWRNSVNLCDPTGKHEVHEATYYFSEDGKVGTRAVHVEKPFMGEEVATCNIQEIFERTINLLLPDRYKRMRSNAAQHGTTSLLAYIDKLLNKDDQEQDLIELRRDFMDCRRSRYGTKDIEQAFVRHQRRGADNIADRRRMGDDEPDLWARIENGEDLTDEDEDAQQGICEADELGPMEEDESTEAE